MEPAKRKAGLELVYTIYSDDEEQPPTKKAKASRRPVEEDNDDDDEFNPDFEFFDAGSDLDFDDEDDVAGKKDLEWMGLRKKVDVNELIKRRLKAEKEEDDDDEEEEEEEKEEEGSEDDEDVGIDGIDLDEEVLAEDGFGMGVDSDEEEEPVEKNEDDDSEEGDDDDEDDEDDEEEEEDEEEQEDIRNEDNESVSSEEDSEELARQEAFFADGEKEKAKQSKEGQDETDNGVRSFQDMRIFSRPILRGISAAGFEKPTSIQAKTMPFAVGGKDVVGQAVTGSGKTAAFLLPILERLLYRPNKVPVTRVVILTPTRELAVQCHKVATKLASFMNSVTIALVVGGTSFKSSEAALRARPDIVIGTPGRFIDHMRNSPGFAVDRVEILVLDEADRMLQDGFADELNEILTGIPQSRQTMLFSATMDASVNQLIRVGLKQPVRVLADAKARTAGTLKQEFVRLRPGRENKRLGCLLQLCTTLYRDHTIIFFNEKRGIHEARIVFGLLGLTCEELHGNIKQAERMANLEQFRRGEVAFLLASDLASRGLDIKGVETVINYEVPKRLEDYIHRIGRTARAGRRGVAVTLVSQEDRKFVKLATKAMSKGKSEDGTKYQMVKRSVDPAGIDQWQNKVDGLQTTVKEVIADEKEARKLAQAELEATRGENMLLHHDEIMSRPKRTWFESAREKEAKKQLQRAEANGKSSGRMLHHKPADPEASLEKARDKLKRKRPGGWLSRKDMKKLDAKADRLKGMGGQKLKQEKKTFETTKGKPGKPGKPGKTNAKGKGKPRK